MYILNADESVIKLEIQPDDSSRQTIGIQEDDILSLSFTHFRCVSIDINDCVFFDGKDYRAMEKYLPEQVTETKWRYNVKLYGPTSLIKRYLVTDNGNVVFPFTGTPAEHLQLIIDSLNRYSQQNGLGTLSIGMVEATEEEITIVYKATYCNEALQQLAEQTGQEWWIKDCKVNLCKCEHGTEINLAYGQELISLERDGDGQKFFTRLYPIGSTKNIDAENYGYERLQLPETDGERPTYIDSSDINKYGVIEHSEEEIFEDIYPTYVGEVSSATQTIIVNPPSIIQNIIDSTMPFYVKDFVEEGKELKISFLTGMLKGLGPDEEGFNVIDYYQEHGAFRCSLRQYDSGDGTMIPNETLKAQKGDLFVFTNIKMPDYMISVAEGKLRAKAEWLLTEARKDTCTYKATTNHVFLQNQDIRLTIGRKVKILSDAFFPNTGEFASRITRISRNVNTPGLADIEISEVLTTSSYQSMAEKVNMVYDSYMEQRKEDKIPTDLPMEWNESMGEIPYYATIITLSEENGETILLPSNPIDWSVIVIENRSNFTKTIAGNGRHIIKNSMDSEADSQTIAKKSKYKFVFYDDNEHEGMPLFKNIWFMTWV